MKNKNMIVRQPGNKPLSFGYWDTNSAWCTIALRCAALFALLAFSSLSTGAQVSVTTWQYNNARTGQNTNETILTPSNVNSTQFGKLFTQTVDGQVYAQPLYIPNLTVNGSVHNVVFVATENDSVYAFDADTNSGANVSPLWHANLIDTAHGAVDGATVVTSAEVNCTDVQPVMGITATPVIDPSTNTMYVEAKSAENGGYVHRLHAIDITTGTEKYPGPIVVDATVSGTGDGSSGGQLVFSKLALSQHSRPGLLLVNGTVYIAFASHCDNNPYHGWVFAYNAATFAQQGVLVTTPNGGLGGIWMSGAGIAADTSGNLFLVTGNGTFDTTNNPATMFGDTILKLALSGNSFTVEDYFTPYNQATLSNGDTDLGSGGVLLLPDQPGTYPHLLVEVGKQGTIYLVNRDQMTTNNVHYCSNCSSDSQIVQELPNAIGGLFSSPSYWNGNVYFWGKSDFLKSYSLTGGLLSSSPGFVGTILAGYPSINPSISSKGTTNGILWVILNSPINGNAVLYAFDPTNVATEFYDTTQAANNRDVAGTYVKFSTPVVTNGKVYVAFASGVAVYGLLSGAGPSAATPQINPSSESFTGTVTVSITDSTPSGLIYYTTDDSNPVPGQGTTKQYTASFNVTTTTTVKALATATGDSNSLIATATYSLQAAPAITSANGTTFAVGTAGSFTVTTTGTPAPALTETGALPSGVTFRDNGNGTAALSGTPALGTAGSYPITTTASNGVGSPANQNFTLTVNGGGGSGGSNFAYVNGSVTGVYSAGNSGTTLSVPLHQTPGAGHLLICAATWASSTATATMSDPNNGTWTAIGKAKAGVGSLSGVSGQMFYVPSAVNASTTVTLTISSAVFGSFECAEYSYTGTIVSLDGTPQYSATPAAGGVATVSGLTTSNTSDLVFADCLGVDTTCTTGSGYTGRNDSNTYDAETRTFGNDFLGFTGQMIEDKVGVAAGAQSATFGTGTATDNVILGLVAY